MLEQGVAPVAGLRGAQLQAHQLGSLDFGARSRDRVGGCIDGRFGTRWRAEAATTFDLAEQRRREAQLLEQPSKDMPAVAACITRSL